MDSKRTWIGLILLVLGVGTALAQSSRGDDWAADFHYGAATGDFNLGLGVKSPAFAGVLNASASADVLWKESPPPGSASGTASTMTAYSTVRAGINLEADAVGGVGRLYTGFGPILLVPGTLSSQNAFGGYGLFGFDFWLPDLASSYFAELGGSITNATADKVAGSPSLQNGFFINTGYRYHF